MKSTKLILLTLLISAAQASYARAQTAESVREPYLEDHVERVVDTSVLKQYIPDTQQLAVLEEKIAREPRNLDHYFAYATLATTLRDYDKAANMYERMLAVAPNLPRIKLELAMVKMHLQEFEAAERLIEDALSQGAPEQVRKNLEPILKQLETATRRHHFGGSLTIGMNHDSNANSAPESGIVNVRINGQELPFVLDENSSNRHDMQVFANVSLNHEYRHPTPIAEGARLSWQSSGSYYRNEYDTLDDLNIKLVSVRTGPAISALDGALRAIANAGYNHIILDGHSYQRQYVGELSAHYMVDTTKRLRMIATHTIRDYINSPTNRSLDQRNGGVNQIRTGMSYQLSPKDTLDVEFRWREENTKREQFDNTQIGGTLSHTHQFPHGFFTRTHVGFKKTDYDGADTSISTKPRTEKETTAGITVGKPLSDSVVATIGYDYRDIEANITNYSYDNHHVSSTLGWRF